MSYWAHGWARIAVTEDAARRRWLLAIGAAVVAIASGIAVAYCLWGGRGWPGKTPAGATGVRYAGTMSCRECHEKFYQLWAPSHHGLAMQPFTAALAKSCLTPAAGAVKVGKSAFRPEFDDRGGWVVESGPDGRQQYPIVQVMGGKNVYYFLTELKGGRLQVLPIAYDAGQRKWYDVPSSGVRHFTREPPVGRIGNPSLHEGPPEADSPIVAQTKIGTVPADAPLDWRHSTFTFNTSCYKCHVSQLSTNYDPATKTYHTAWAEPGINCETCHGPGEEHVRLFRSLPKGSRPADWKIIRTKEFSAGQINDSCAPCHAKMSPLDEDFRPGDRYFDHFDLVTLEDRDFYPDGRDLGENYTFTSWRMSPCAQSGKLSCLKCHTSSGQYLFKTDPNQACASCHAQKVAHVTAHSFHKAGSTGSQCVACHMPTTRFAAMQRTDHSMRPPMPAATLAFGSPNACNRCHADKDAAWADGWVRKWRRRDYQASVLRWAGLIEAARQRDWRRLPEMLNEIAGGGEVPAASLARLLGDCPAGQRRRRWRRRCTIAGRWCAQAAVEGLENFTTNGTGTYKMTLAALAAACGDDCRLVRVRAAAVLAGAPADLIRPQRRPQVERATAEYLASLMIRPRSLVVALQSGKLPSGYRRRRGSGGGFRDGHRLGAGGPVALRQHCHGLRPAGQERRGRGRPAQGESRSIRAIRKPA